MKYSTAQFKEDGRAGGLKSSAQRWRSLIDPSLQSTKAGLVRMHLKRGYPTDAVERVEG